MLYWQLSINLLMSHKIIALNALYFWHWAELNQLNYLKYSKITAILPHIRGMRSVHRSQKWGTGWWCVSWWLEWYCIWYPSAHKQESIVIFNCKWSNKWKSKLNYFGNTSGVSIYSNRKYTCDDCYMYPYWGWRTSVPSLSAWWELSHMGLFFIIVLMTSF